MRHIPIHELGLADGRVIGHAVYEGDRLLALVSHYDFRDTNYDGEVSLWERFAGNLFSVGQARFVDDAYKEHLRLVGTSQKPDIDTINEIRRGQLLDILNDIETTLETIELVENVISAYEIGFQASLLLNAALSEGTLPQVVASRFGGDFLDSFLEGVPDAPSPSISNVEIIYTDGSTPQTYSGSNNVTAVVIGGSGSITSGSGDDNIIGNSGNDTVESGSGSDTIYTGAGADNVTTGAGSNYVDAGTGNDTIDARTELNSSGSIFAGDGDDLILAGSATYSPNFDDYYLNVDGGSGTDTLVLEARDHYNPGVILHRFEGIGILSASSSSEEILGAIASGSTHEISTGRTYSWGYRYSWVEVNNIERIEYVGSSEADLLLGWNMELVAAYGGAGIDTLAADWEAESVDIVWNLADSADAALTLANGVVVQSIERVILVTGSGNDQLVLGDEDDHVVTGAGADNVTTGAGTDYVEDGRGTDLIDTGSGADIVVFHGTAYHTAGYVAFNVSSDTQVGTQARISLEGLARIEAVTDGGADADIVQLSEEGDAFFLHDAYSGFHSSVALTEDYVGNESIARFANIEEIRGMGGDDIIDLTSPDYSLSGVSITIDGGNGNDVIWGSDANENISGGNGNDTIFGGIGTDLITGGAGADVFEFTRTSTNTFVTDFNVSEGDTLRFYNVGGAEFDASSVALTATGIIISYTDTVSGIEHDISMVLAPSASEFTATLSEIQSALEII